MKRIKLPIEVLCCHKEEEETVEMTITEDDPEVPTYRCKCLKCGKEVIIAFGDFLTDEQKESAK